MVTVYVTKKTCERILLPLDLSKVVDYEISNVSVKDLETNSESQEILMVGKTVCVKRDGTYSYLLRHL